MPLPGLQNNYSGTNDHSNPRHKARQRKWGRTANKLNYRLLFEVEKNFAIWGYTVCIQLIDRFHESFNNSQ